MLCFDETSKAIATMTLHDTLDRLTSTVQDNQQIN